MIRACEPPRTWEMFLIAFIDTLLAPLFLGLFGVERDRRGFSQQRKVTRVGAAPHIGGARD